jgi:hypothetical protein
MTADALFCPPAKSFPVQLGEMVFYVQQYQIRLQRIVAEQASPEGKLSVTNSSVRGCRLTLTCQWVVDDDPSSMLLVLDQYLRMNVPFSFVLRQMQMKNCRLVQYTATENGGEPVMTCQLEILVQEPMEEVAET